MQGAPPASWNLSDPKHDVDPPQGGVSTAPVMTGTTLSGTASLSGSVGPFAGLPSNGTPWRWRAYLRYAAVVVGVQLVLGALLLATSIQIAQVNDQWEYTNQPLVVENGSGRVVLGPEFDGLSVVSVWSDAQTSDGRWLDASLGFEDWTSWDDPAVDVQQRPLEFSRPRPLPANLTLTFEHDSATKTMWFNGSAFEATTFLGGGVDYYNTTTGRWTDLEPVVSENGTAYIAYGDHTGSSACELGGVYLRFEHPGPNAGRYDEAVLEAWPTECWRRGEAEGPPAPTYEWSFFCACEYESETVGAWSPSNRTFWVGGVDAEVAVFNMGIDLINREDADAYASAELTHGVMLTVFPLGCIITYIVVPIVGGRGHGKAGAFGALTGVLMAPLSFIGWIAATFAGW